MAIEWKCQYSLNREKIGKEIMTENEKSNSLEEKNEDILNPDEFGVDDDASKNDDDKSLDDDKLENPSNPSDDNVKDQNKDWKNEKNALFAKRRREKEQAEKDRKDQEQKIREEARLQTELELTKTNPYTDEPINDEEDLKIYKIQKEIEKSGGDPINDLPKKLAEINRQERAKRQESLSKENAEREKLQKDIDEFHQKYPKVNLKELADDKDFIDFAADKQGRMKLEEIYEFYQLKKKDRVSQQAEKQKQEFVDKQSDKTSGVPSSSSSTNVPSPKTYSSYAEYQEAMNKKYGG